MPQRKHQLVMPTVEHMMSKCEYDMKKGCLIWTGTFKRDIWPVVSLRKQDPGSDRPWAYAMARRVMYELRTGKRLGDRDLLVPKCGDDSCISHLHAKVMTHKQVGRRAAKNGSFNHPDRIRAITISARKRPGVKCSEEIAAAIRASGLPNVELARKYGVHKSFVSLIKRGKAWAPINPVTSVFSLAEAI